MRLPLGWVTVAGRRCSPPGKINNKLFDRRALDVECLQHRSSRGDPRNLRRNEPANTITRKRRAEDLKLCRLTFTLLDRARHSHTQMVLCFNLSTFPMQETLRCLLSVNTRTYIGQKNLEFIHMTINGAIVITEIIF